MTTRTEQFATLYGIGHVPYAPGTAASLAAAIVAWPISIVAGPVALGALGLVAAVLAIKVSGDYATEIGQEDPHDCVIDELAGQWIACALAPTSWLGFALAFLLFRLFDMAKPWPVSAAEKLNGGLGIVADDVVAGLIGGGVVLLLWQSGFL